MLLMIPGSEILGISWTWDALMKAIAIALLCKTIVPKESREFRMILQMSPAHREMLVHS